MLHVRTIFQSVKLFRFYYSRMNYSMFSDINMSDLVTVWNYVSGQVKLRGVKFTIKLRGASTCLLAILL